MLLLTGESGRALGKVTGVSWPCHKKQPCAFRKRMKEGISWCETALAQTPLPASGEGLGPGEELSL